MQQPQQSTLYPIRQWSGTLTLYVDHPSTSSPGDAPANVVADVLLTDLASFMETFSVRYPNAMIVLT